jgi:hypothetical protein
MSKVIRSKDSNGIFNTLVLEEGDMAVIEKLRSRKEGSVKLTISAVSANGETIFITRDKRTYEVQRKDLF